MDSHEILDTLADRLARRIAEVQQLLRLDHAIQADPYDDVARLKELQRVRRWITALQVAEPGVHRDFRKPRPVRRKC